MIRVNLLGTKEPSAAGPVIEPGLGGGESSEKKGILAGIAILGLAVGAIAVQWLSATRTINDLDEKIIESLKAQDAKISIWGVGTKLATAYDQPALGGVYKLGALMDAAENWQPKVKLSEQAIKTSIPGILQVRRFDGATKPLLAPEEAVYLELNLRLMLERSQLAALRRQQLVYEQSLASAQDWLREYLDEQDPVVEELVKEVDELLTVQLDQALPDVSGSLAALLAVRRGAS